MQSPTDKLPISVIAESWKHANAYLIHTTSGQWLLDPAVLPAEVGDIKLAGIIATHAHFDHVSQIETWLLDQEIPFVMHEEDIALLDDPQANASKFFGHPQCFKHPNRAVIDGSVINLSADLQLRVIHSPGHTPGSSCFLLERMEGASVKALALFTGDTLFADSCGRTDLPFGNQKQMNESLAKLKRLLTDLPADMPIFSGHGRAEKNENLLKTNPFMRRI